MPLGDERHTVVRVFEPDALNYFTCRENIHKLMRKEYPMAAIDIETAAFYRPEDLQKLKI